jgi:short-subunit dehydrogenase
VVVADLTHDGSVAALESALAGTGAGPVELLVNNAGFGQAGAFADADPRTLEAMLQLNVVALSRLTRHFVTGMRRRGSGRILNVASLAGFQPGGPGMAAYFASKAYVLSLGRALARELRGSGVSVTTLCPGPVRTEFEETAGGGQLRAFRWLPVASAESVAEAGIKAVLAGRPTCVPGLANRLLGLAGRLSPVVASLQVNAFLLGPRGGRSRPGGKVGDRG